MPQLTEKTVIKVLVCGDRFVGKSSVVSSWSASKKNGKFIEKRKNSQAEITRMEINNQYFVDFYVFGWGEPPSSYNEVLSEKTNFVLIVYDTSNNQSWINATSVWLDWFEKFSPNVNIMLLGTKTDTSRKVSSIKDCENFCKSYILKREEAGNYGVGNGLFFMEVSPKIGTNMDLTLSILLIRISHLVSILKENDDIPQEISSSSFQVLPTTPRNGSSMHQNNPHSRIESNLYQNNPPSTNDDSINSMNYQNNPHSRNETSLYQNIPSSMNQNYNSSQPQPSNVEQSKIPLYNTGPNLTDEFRTPTSQLKKKVSSSSQTPTDFARSKQIQDSYVPDFNDFQTNSEMYGINASGFITLPPTTETQEELRFPSSTKANFTHKVQSYQETKEGFVVPVVETDLFPNPQKLNYFRPVTTFDNSGAKLILSINLGEGRICKVGVVSGDNIFQLADLVIKQHQVDPKLRQEIAFNIRNSINKYIEKQQGTDSFKKNNNPKIREAEQFNQTAHSLFQNSTSFQPFNFASDHLQTRPIRPPILQLKITISKGKSGVIMVREGDDITELAKNFINTFGLKREQLPKIVEKIKKHLEVEQESDQPEEVLQPPLQIKPNMERDFKPEPKRKTLFNLDVEISEGNSKILTIREGDIATNVAKEFSRRNGIGGNAEVMLVQLIQYHLKNYLDQKSKQ
ncbi:predicted protein [Naegleria gruberi]|uniref:Predicted protein n=1 Tax=Naegleria gruberi TaxID=5762 RepID=D2UXD5_NAEGR|nr:uncharacterized protein NAEGRDRAFT_61085 [Naegleria gruberi]EFC50614.1 predicted protein [Naegleria gruberi]|eukprot:XP_002683358.1 predicted protein [Naegleria gruberi strain NEG-M]